MARQILSDLDFASVSRQQNLLNPVSPQEPATKAYVDSAIEGLAWKDNARVRSTSNINLASPGTSVDGVTLAVGDRFLADGQTTVAAKGIYVYNGAAVAATRALDANTADELENATISIDEGTSAGTSWRQTSVNFVLDTAAIAFVPFGTVAPAATETNAGIAQIATQAIVDAGTNDTQFVTAKKLAAYANGAKRYSVTFGDGTATSYVITHGLGTRDVDIEVVRSTSPYDSVSCDIERTSTSTATLRFSAAVASNALRAIVQG